jgi:hypothetical protein
VLRKQSAKHTQNRDLTVWMQLLLCHTYEVS